MSSSLSNKTPGAHSLYQTRKKFYIKNLEKGKSNISNLVSV